MELVTGNLWDFDADLRVITTNGATRKDGAAVMGRGCAREAKDKFPGIEYELGRMLTQFGNVPIYFSRAGLLTLPVKHHWAQPADLDLIRKSLPGFIAHVDGIKAKRVVMPRPGCGNGQRTWEEVEPLLADLDERFFVITFPR